MALHKYWTSLEFLDPVYYFATGVFLQFTMIIPVLIYPSRGPLYWSNSIFILLLIMVREPINELLGFPISAIDDQVKSYYLFDALIVTTSSFYLLYNYSKYKAIHSQKDENESIKKQIVQSKFHERIFNLDLTKSPPDPKIEAYLSMALEEFEVNDAFIMIVDDNNVKSVLLAAPQGHYHDRNSEDLHALMDHLKENSVVWMDCGISSELNALIGAESDIKKYYGHALQIDGEFFGAVHLISDSYISKISEINLQLFHNLVVHIQNEIQNKIRREEIIVNEQLALIAKETTNVVVVTDPYAQILWVNKAFTTLCGYELSEVLGRKPSKFLHGPETDQREVDKMRAAIKAGTTCTAQVINYSKGGAKYWLDIRLVPIKDANGTIKKFIAIETDITYLINQVEELKQNRIQLDLLAKNLKKQTDKLELALSSGDLLAWEADLKTDQIFFYPEDLEISFFDRKEKINNINTLINQVINSSHREVYRKNLSVQNEELFHSELATIGNSGSEQWKYVTGRASEFDAEGIPTKITGIFQDVSWKKRAEAGQLLGEEIERIRVSRDIHDSIGQMLVGVRLLFEEKMRHMEPAMKADFHDIDQYLHKTIKESRLIIKKLGSSYLEFDSFYEAVDKLTLNMKMISKARIELKWSGEGTLSNQKMGIEIFRILQESLINAIKYAEATIIRVEVTNNLDFIDIKIIDDGIGFESLLLNDSTGFGIDNMRNRAKNIEADLNIESELGKGTVISLVREI